MQMLPPALAPLAAYRQFLCYVLVPSQTRPGKMDKFPVSPHTGQVVTAHDPQHWSTAEHACAMATAWGAQYGVAFSFQASDPFFFVDIDGCFDGANWSPLALEVAAMFPGAAMELSQSGKGMHIIGRGVAPAHGKKNVALNMEFYTELRFAALTGVNAIGDAGTDHTAALYAITEKYFPANASAQGDFSLSDAPVAEWRGPTDDADLLRRALNSKSAAAAFGRGVTFADLWEANAEVLGRVYPDKEGRPYDESAADAALVSYLSFWTGRHGERIHRLMLQSGLKRDKWERPDYLPRTIAEILARPGDVLKDKAPEPPPVPQASAAGETPTQTAITGQMFLDGNSQKAVFAGCVYVQDRHRVLVPGGMLLKPDQFRVAFGGYTFSMDNVNERTTRNAWEAFTESQILRCPRADTICFKPDRPPGEIINDGGKKRVNTWWPAEVRRVVGDAGPFFMHLEKVLPDQRDRHILLSYMAACVQHKGIKFPWAPVLQGVEGNGKTLFSACVAEAVGQHYTHWPHAADLASPFNGWLADKVFVALEELHSADHSFSTDAIVERLKTMITGGMGIQIQYKGVDQASMTICANFMATTNYKTAVRKTPDNMRRLAVFFTAQQTAEDLRRYGMDGDYFPRLYHWLKYQDGFAIVSELLHTFPIPAEFNPAGSMHRAPHTSTTDAAIIESRGSVEQQIAEVIAQDTPGFMGGWVSSVMLDRLITETLKMGNRLSHTKRKELMHGMGYILHPGLRDGRVDNAVQPDGKKPQLYVLKDSAAAAIVGPAEIAKAYSAAQAIR